ncbi:MAG: hypothetical protein KAR47_11930, partial [Planctomycetes bacterium]|nr:hypothetical protein [Planctomycetota bacterium]
RNIQNSWDLQEAKAEMLQNGRVLTDHIYRNLIEAVQITAISDPGETNGYIEYKANDGITYRYDIGADNYVEFGEVGDLSGLAGPVGKLQFTCYDAYDLDTPITDIDAIRCVKVETIVTNSGALGQDKTFTAAAYLRTHSYSDSGTGVLSTAISVEGGSSSNLVLDMPSPRPDGDLYIAQIAQQGGGSINGPAGWTQIMNRETQGNVRLAVYWKIGSSEPATYTWSSNATLYKLGAIFQIGGINAGSPINASDDDVGDSRNPIAPSVTTSVGNCLILMMYAAEGDEQVSGYWPSGTTGIFQGDSSGNVVAAAAYIYQNLAGSTGAGAFKMASAKKWVGATVAIPLVTGIPLSP